MVGEDATIFQFIPKWRHWYLNILLEKPAANLGGLVSRLRDWRKLNELWEFVRLLTLKVRLLFPLT